MFDVPVVALRDTVVFPGMVLPLRIGRTPSVRAIEAAFPDKKEIFLVAERDEETLYDVGTVAQIAQLVRLPDGTYQALIQGLDRARATAYMREGEMRSAHLDVIEDPVLEKTLEIEALMRTVVDQVEKYADLS